MSSPGDSGASIRAPVMVVKCPSPSGPSSWSKWYRMKARIRSSLEMRLAVEPIDPPGASRSRWPPVRYRDISDQSTLAIDHVVVDPTDAYLELSAEAIAIADFPVYDPLIVGATEGTYLVNVDVQPGRYRVEDSRYAYAAKLSCDRDIIGNAGNAGNVIIVVKDSDCLFEFSGILTRID